MEKFEHGGNIYHANGAGEGWLDFSANINPAGLSPAVRAAIAASVDDVIHYPDPAAAELKAALSKRYNVAEENLVLGNGAAELFYLFLQTVRPRRVLLPVPSFSEYERAAVAARCKVNCFALSAENEFRIDWEEFMAALTVTDCIILGNPNNPTGTLLTRNELVKLLEVIKEGPQWLVVDESFLDFLLFDSRYTVRDLVEEYPHLFVVQSLTKFYALPGLRLGFGTAAPELAGRLNAGKDVWNVNLLAQKAGVAALADLDYQQQSRQQLIDEMQRFYERINGCRGIRAFKPSVNFMLLDVSGTGLTSSEFTARLRGRGILVRDCANYTGIEDDCYVRIAIRKPEENDRLLALLEEF
ncbi:L-threonine O-3-phosphate decarboxylase [Selenomonas sp. GACV-9]|uniref:threonine-phosphate decarboxylase CobD n=1 Tax=Selenomonas sp. GACV-9 TaxID=3158782 RepID=UPI0008E86313|nr:L-threonine O-3-phosphate decarboxylase [Selenomonas ruminantium]